MRAKHTTDWRGQNALAYLRTSTIIITSDPDFWGTPALAWGPPVW